MNCAHFYLSVTLITKKRSLLLDPWTVAPDCTIKYIAHNGDDGASSALECAVNASPEVVNYTWSKNNRTLDGINGNSLNSSSVAAFESELHSFTCIASNNQGSSKPCKLQAHHLNGSY